MSDDLSTSDSLGLKGLVEQFLVFPGWKGLVSARLICWHHATAWKQVSSPLMHAQLRAGRQYAWHIEHGGHGGPPMFPAVASAQLTQVDEVVQPKRQRNDHPVPQGAPDVLHRCRLNRACGLNQRNR